MEPLLHLRADGKGWSADQSKKFSKANLEKFLGKLKGVAVPPNAEHGDLINLVKEQVNAKLGTAARQ
jgi:hypothetical protein